MTKFYVSLAIPIEFIKYLTGARVNENDKVNFMCELNKLNIHVKWFHDEEPISNGRIKRNSDFTRQLKKFDFLCSFFKMNILKFKLKVHCIY